MCMNNIIYMRIHTMLVQTFRLPIAIVFVLPKESAYFSKQTWYSSILIITVYAL